jgi:iron complex transport system substrate-binding protein
MSNKRIHILLAFVLAFSLFVAACTSPTPAPTATPEPTDAPIPVLTATPEPMATPELTDTPAPTEPPSPYPMTITDGAGREVTIEAEPQAIVSLAPSNTEILYALELGDRIVGVTEFCNYPSEAAEKPKVGGFSDVDTEKLVAQDPDLVLVANLHVGEVVPALEQLGLTVAVVAPPDVPAVLESIKLVGQITGKDAEAAALTAEMQERIDAVAQAVEGQEKPRVFWEVSSDLWTAGPGSFINDLIVRAGGENIAADAESAWAQLSNEAIIAADPEIVFLADHPFGESAETVAARPGWDAISAVANDRIVEVVDTDMFSRPGPRVVDALEMAAKALHPDAFE